MPNIGPMEIVVVLIIALVVFGPKRLPELGKSLGKGIQEFKGTISGEKTRLRRSTTGDRAGARSSSPRRRRRRKTPAPRAETARLRQDDAARKSNLTRG